MYMTYTKNDSLFIWSSSLARCPVFLFAKPYQWIHSPECLGAEFGNHSPRALGQFFNVKFHLFWINKLYTWIFQKLLKNVIEVTKLFCDWVYEWRYLDYEEWGLCWLMKIWPVRVEPWAVQCSFPSSPEVTWTKPKCQTKASGTFHRTWFNSWSK